MPRKSSQAVIAFLIAITASTSCSATGKQNSATQPKATTTQVAAAASSSAASAMASYSVCSLPPDAQAAFRAALASGYFRQAAIDKLISLDPRLAAAKTAEDKAAVTKRAADKVDAVLNDAPSSDLSVILRSIVEHAASASDTVIGGKIVLTKAEGEALLHVATDAAVAISSAEPPQNILCSESILTWQEVSDTLGRKIANTYIVVQVTIRNLDSDHEFLLHDIQAMLNTERFHATHDRRVARGVAEMGQILDPRNIIINSATALGASVGAAQAILSSQAIIGLNIWQSGVIPGMKMIFPDYTVRQLSRLDDLGFSSGATTMVIPKSGSLAVLSFLPQKTFLWKCQPTGVADPSPCGDPPKVKGLSHPIGSITGRAKRLKDLSETEMNLLQDQVQILAAGVHVQDVDKSVKKTAAIAAFTCDPDAYKRMFDVNEVHVTCSLTGIGLDQIGSLRLQKVGESAGGNMVDGRVTPDPKDSTKATATFTACALNNLGAGEYEILADAGTTKTTQAATFTKADVDKFVPTFTADEKAITVSLLGISADEKKSITKLYINGIEAKQSTTDSTTTYTLSSKEKTATVTADIGTANRRPSCLPAAK
jgi:hypothetical protein